MSLSVYQSASYEFAGFESTRLRVLASGGLNEQLCDDTNTLTMLIELEDSRTCRLGDVKTCRLADLQTRRPADLKT